RLQLTLLRDDDARPGKAGYLSSRIANHCHRQIEFNRAAMFAEQPAGAAKHSLLQRLLAHRIPGVDLWDLGANATDFLVDQFARTIPSYHLAGRIHVLQYTVGVG